MGIVVPTCNEMNDVCVCMYDKWILSSSSSSICYSCEDSRMPSERARGGRVGGEFFDNGVRKK